MNINIGNVALGLVIGASTHMAMARGSLQTPTIAIVSDDAPLMGENELVSGVLGFDNVCGYALYADRRSAAERDSAKGISIGKPGPEAVQIGHGIGLENVIGRYVYAQGDIRYSPASALRDLKVESIYAFVGEAGRPVQCEPLQKHPVVRATSILKNPEPYEGREVGVVGIMASSDGRLVLLTDMEGALAGAPNEIILRIAPSQRDVIRSWGADRVWVAASGRLVGPAHGKQVVLEKATLRLLESVSRHDDSR